MRIGRTIIDLDSLSVEDLTAVIDTARKIRARKQKAISLLKRMNELLNEAKAEDFIFINEYTGQALPQEYIKVIDEQ